MEYAESEFKLGVKQSDGQSLRVHLKAAGELKPSPPVPEITSHVWEWFFDLHSERSSGLGLTPITRKHISEWAQATGTRIEPWEARAIRLIDAAFVRINQTNGEVV